MINNLHPILASFPFPIMVTVFITELVAYFGVTKNWRLFSCYLVILGSIFSIGAYYSGIYQMSSASLTFYVSEELIAKHQEVARMQLMSLIPLSLFSIIRSLKPNEFLHWIFVPFLILTLLLTGSASHKGGSLVFEHGAGISRKCEDKTSTIEEIENKEKLETNNEK